MPKCSLLIAYAHGGIVHEPFMCSLLEFQACDYRGRGILHSVCGAMGPEITDNRNRAVRRFLSVDATHLLFIDTDIVFQPADVYRLVDDDLPIVSGLYFGRPGSFTSPVPVWYGPRDGRVDVIREITAQRPQKLYGCGMGFCLIRRDVLEAFPEPENDEWRWFARDWHAGERKRLSEDLTFCQRARNLGFEIWGDHAVRVAHLKTSALDWDCFIRESGTVVGVRQPEGQAAEPAGTAGMVQLNDPRSGPRSEGGRHLGPKLVAAAVRNGTIR